MAKDHHALFLGPQGKSPLWDNVQIFQREKKTL
jgi:hypothetical protein